MSIRRNCIVRKGGRDVHCVSVEISDIQISRARGNCVQVALPMASREFQGRNSRFRVKTLGAKLVS